MTPSRISAMLFVTSDAPPRAVITNDTAVRFRVFSCTDPECRHGDPTTDEVLEPVRQRQTSGSTPMTTARSRW